MTAIYRFYGASDDLIEVDGPPNYSDEFSATTGIWRGLLMSPAGEAVEVIARYGDNTACDCWSFAVAQPSEGVPLPPWQYRFRPAIECSYSVELVIEAPHGTVLKADCGADA